MSDQDAGPGEWPVVVRVPVEPVEAAMEADALDAAARHTSLAVRGPLFGVAAQDQDGRRRWRVVVEVTHGCPQQARDALNSLLWFQAKDEAQSRQERRALLAGVARLEKEPVDELTVLGTRYRVVRAEEYAAVDELGAIETPRPTDPEPLTRDWSSGARSPRVDAGLVLDPDAPLSPLQAAERVALRPLAYSGIRFPDPVLTDSARAVESHPDVLLMPAAFLIVERSGGGSWSPGSGLQATAHHARRILDFALTWMEPRTRGLIPYDADRTVDARHPATGTTDKAAAALKEFAEAADRLRAGRCDEVEAHGTVYRIARSRRLLRWGPDGPESPRPSDTSTHTPAALHPRLDEDGTVHFDEPAADEPAN
ncbi:hypothetical protein HHL19_19085 [Streptomyces sp. R302]|uniref:DUF5954 family protein n=1 Tax=unclassified Streptomyces TaxID=2593676 RepID=UPI00145F7A12|nr:MULTISPECIES: DUF5954 family protein [unclassified Streptomyces]NML54715.1 hypothetical protein [Streptomyces sp. R301]NML80716.1 hypothetical protein [Streptomyces sp. R302]